MKSSKIHENIDVHDQNENTKLANPSTDVQRIHTQPTDQSIEYTSICQKCQELYTNPKPNSKPKSSDLFKKMYSYFNLKNTMVLFNGIYLDVMVGSLINLSYLGFDGGSESLNAVLSLVVFLGANFLAFY